MTFFIIWAIVLAVVAVYSLIHWGFVALNKRAPAVADTILGALVLLAATALVALFIWSLVL
jgi:hypothetical protein